MKHEGGLRISVADLDELGILTRHYESLATSGVSYTKLVKHLDHTFDRSRFMFKPILRFAGSLLSRARPLSRRPSHISELSYPPAAMVSVNGRLNAAGESLFYASIGESATPFVEVGAQAGETYALSVWSQKEDLLINHLGFSRSLMERLQPSRKFYPGLGPANDSEAVSFPSEWMSGVFTKRVSKGNENEYRPSIGLAKWAFSHTDLDGVLYPSIPFASVSDNVALRPETVDAKIQLEKVRFVVIDEILSAVTSPRLYAPMYKFRILDQCGRPGPTGRLDWLSEPTAFRHLAPYPARSRKI